MKTTSIDNIAKPGSDKHQMEDLPAMSIKKRQITPRQIIRVITDFIQELYDIVYDFAVSILNTFPWLFIFYLLLPIYTATELIAQMFSEQGVALMFNDRAQLWIGYSFQLALLTGVLLASLRFMRNHGVFLKYARARQKEQDS